METQASLSRRWVKNSSGISRTSVPGRKVGRPSSPEKPFQTDELKNSLSCSTRMSHAHAYLVDL